MSYRQTIRAAFKPSLQRPFSSSSSRPVRQLSRRPRTRFGLKYGESLPVYEEPHPVEHHEPNDLPEDVAKNLLLALSDDGPVSDKDGFGLQPDLLKEREEKTLALEWRLRQAVSEGRSEADEARRLNRPPILEAYEDAAQDSPFSGDGQFGLRSEVLKKRKRERTDGSFVSQLKEATSASTREAKSSSGRGVSPSDLRLAATSYTDWTALANSLQERRKEQAWIAKNDEKLRKVGEVEGYDPDEVSFLYVGGIPASMTEDVLRTEFGKFGEIEDITFPEQLFENHWIEYARIRFKSPSVVQGLARKQFHDFGKSKLVLRSSLFGREEKPIYLGKPGSALRVDNLPSGIMQQEVREAFERYSMVEYVHVPRAGNHTRGWVTFFSEEGAQSVVDAAAESGGISINGKVLNLSVVTNRAETRIPTNALFVGSTHQKISRAQIRQLFEGIVPMLTITIQVSSSGSAGFVVFPSIKEAQKILDMHHLLPFTYKENQLKLNYCDNTVVGKGRFPIQSLFIGNIIPEATLPQLKEVFKQYAPRIKEITITRRADKPEATGYAHMRMNTIADAERILINHSRRRFRLLDNNLDIRYAKRGYDDEAARDLYITNFGTLRALNAYLSEYQDHIVRINTYSHKAEWSKTFLAAFVRFVDVVWAMRAKIRMSGRPMRDGMVPVIKYAASRSRDEADTADHKVNNNDAPELGIDSDPLQESTSEDAQHSQPESDTLQAKEKVHAGQSLGERLSNREIHLQSSSGWVLESVAKRGKILFLRPKPKSETQEKEKKQMASESIASASSAAPPRPIENSLEKPVITEVRS
ncbi:hypothetical protein EIP91_010476 [Steccherinum ochraceum]|uniref:RRM domain-containing protein n=1 Tax=Steccherinum ochraceum TaxID=92696 RepID=A0A4R0RJH4_9APHY|nr:hypothetical protein EIP91_010476 [Steccherinum ochraceum]